MARGTPTFILVALSVMAQACASSGTNPHDMGAARHEELARVEEQRSARHVTEGQKACPGYPSSASCYHHWTSFRNPAKEQFDEAARHRTLAEKHRAASRALREAEAGVCAGIPDQERDMSPFFHTEDIVNVERIAVPIGGETLTGARVVFQWLPGMTSEWLQRVVDCHLARNAVLGYPGDHLGYCPLGVKGVTAPVTSVADGLQVEIRPSDKAGSQEVGARMSLLLQTRRSRLAR